MKSLGHICRCRVFIMAVTNTTTTGYYSHGRKAFIMAGMPPAASKRRLKIKYCSCAIKTTRCYRANYKTKKKSPHGTTRAPGHRIWLSSCPAAQPRSPSRRRGRNMSLRMPERTTRGRSALRRTPLSCPWTPDLAAVMPQASGSCHGHARGHRPLGRGASRRAGRGRSVARSDLLLIGSDLLHAGSDHLLIGSSLLHPGSDLLQAGSGLLQHWRR